VAGQAQLPSLSACASRLSELCQRFFTALSVLQACPGSGCARASAQRARGSSGGARRRTCQAGAWQCRPSGCHMPGGPAARGRASGVPLGACIRGAGDPSTRLQVNGPSGGHLDKDRVLLLAEGNLLDVRGELVAPGPGTARLSQSDASVTYSIAP